MACRPMPKKKYQMHDGTMGTEYEALSEVLKILEAKHRLIEEDIELIKLRMQTAEGRP